MNRQEALDVITRVLYEDWDPIGVRGCGDPDEYRPYARHVYKMLEEGCNVRDLALHLSKAAKDSMGLSNLGEQVHVHAAEQLLEVRASHYRRAES